MADKDESNGVDPSVGFLFKTMLKRDPRKRRVKPVQKHLIQVDFGGLDSDEDSDFNVDGEEKGSEDDDIEAVAASRRKMMEVVDSPIELSGDSDSYHGGRKIKQKVLDDGDILISDDNSRDAARDISSEAGDDGSDVDCAGYEGVDCNDETIDLGSTSCSNGVEEDSNGGDDETDDYTDDESDVYGSGEDNDQRDKEGDLHQKLMNIGSSDDEDDEDYIPKKMRNKMKSIPNVIKEVKVTPEKQAPYTNVTKLLVQKTKNMKVIICCVCLGEVSHSEDEIVECDNCGVAVHEGCYGVSDNQSAASTESSASTEPWFCDSCKAGVTPHCELCPNEGGIYKETDAGKWVHLVCALYTPGVAFGDVDRLSPVTLFEMNYSRWGLKECSLCEDVRFSRTGVCVGCDAGMCRINFHVTCAQRQGLLSEAAPEEILDIADPFFAYCKMHADKGMMKMKRKNWLAVQSRTKDHVYVSAMDESKEKTRYLRKLQRHRDKYAATKANKQPSWLPSKKVAKFLHNCPYAVKCMLKKAELMGVTQVQHVNPEKHESRKKSYVAPAFTQEYITYYMERDLKVQNLKNAFAELSRQNDKLYKQEEDFRVQYDTLCIDSDALKESSDRMRKEAESLWTMMAQMGKKKHVLPDLLKPKKIKSPTRRGVPLSPPTVIRQCGICKKTNDQHMLAKCDECKLSYHLGCLDPPLTRLPKKSKLFGWQCSNCARMSSDDSSEKANINTDAPRQLREKRKAAVKFTPPHIQENVFKFTENTAKKFRNKCLVARTVAAKIKKATCPLKSMKLTGRRISQIRKKRTPPKLKVESFKKEKPTETPSKKDRPTETASQKDRLIETPAVTETDLLSPNKARLVPVVSITSTKAKTEPVIVSVRREPPRTEAESSFKEECRKIRPRRSVPADETTPVKKIPERKVQSEPTKAPLSKVSPNRKKILPKRFTESAAEGASTAKVAKLIPSMDCCVCNGSGKLNTNIVKCDECQLYFHFQCLDPPVKKNPKPRGYTWKCENCVEMDDEDQHD